MENATVTKLCMCPECGGASLLCPHGTTTLPLYTAPPEPVNQQLLAALKALIDMDVSYQRGPKVEQAVEAARAAIAAAEAAQPDHIGDTDKMVHAVPNVLEQLQLAETEVTNAKAWSAGEQAKTHCKYALTAIAVARSLLSAAQKPEGV